jgi:phage repressor protein C with HTH and peptisase S24 domain
VVNNFCRLPIHFLEHYDKNCTKYWNGLIKMNTAEVGKVANSVANTPSENATEFGAVFARLKDATRARTDTELAQALSLRQSTISAAKSKKEIPPGWIIDIARRFNISSDWLLFGSGPMRRDDNDIAHVEAQNSCPIPEGEPQWMSPEAAPRMGYSLIPKVMARLCAGTGSLETEGKVIGYYAFKTDFLRRKGRPSKMVLMDVTGDSMEPVLMDCDTVLIDEGQRDIISGGMFAVGVDQEVFVKYLDKVPGKLILRSRNERFAPIEVDMNGELTHSVRVIGRIVWSCREYVR